MHALSSQLLFMLSKRLFIKKRLRNYKKLKSLPFKSIQKLSQHLTNQSSFGEVDTVPEHEISCCLGHGRLGFQGVPNCAPCHRCQRICRHRGHGTSESSQNGLQVSGLSGAVGFGSSLWKVFLARPSLELALVSQVVDDIDDTSLTRSPCQSMTFFLTFESKTSTWE